MDFFSIPTYYLHIFLLLPTNTYYYLPNTYYHHPLSFKFLHKAQSDRVVFV